MQRLMNYARKEAARWARTFGKDRPNARAAEAMGTVSRIWPVYTRSCRRSLGHMRYVEVYARLLESGKVRTYGKLNKAERAAVEAELMEALREEQQRAEAAYELNARNFVLGTLYLVLASSLSSVLGEITVADREGGVAVEHIAVVATCRGRHVAQSGAGVEEVLQIVGAGVA